LPTTYNNVRSIETCVEYTSVESFSCKTVDHHAPVISRNSKSQSRPIINSLSVISELPQSFYDHTYPLESFQQYSHHNSDRVPTLGTQEHGTHMTEGVRDLTESLPDSSLVSNEIDGQ
jgi:hypothetical protein